MVKPYTCSRQEALETPKVEKLNLESNTLIKITRLSSVQKISFQNEKKNVSSSGEKEH